MLGDFWAGFPDETTSIEGSGQTFPDIQPVDTSNPISNPDNTPNIPAVNISVETTEFVKPDQGILPTLFPYQYPTIPNLAPQTATPTPAAASNYSWLWLLGIVAAVFLMGKEGKK